VRQAVVSRVLLDLPPRTRVAPPGRPALERAVARADRARQLLADRYRHLVPCVAQQLDAPGVSAEQLELAGREGLQQAIDTFEPAHGSSLEAYVAWCIDKAMRRRVAERCEPPSRPG